MLVLLCLKENTLQQPKYLVMSLTLNICFILTHGLILHVGVFFGMLFLLTTDLGIVVV